MKTKTISISYTLKAFAKNIIKLSQAGIVSEKENRTLTEIKNKAVQKYIQKEYSYQLEPRYDTGKEKNT